MRSESPSYWLESTTAESEANGNLRWFLRRNHHQICHFVAVEYNSQLRIRCSAMELFGEGEESSGVREAKLLYLPL